MGVSTQRLAHEYLLHKMCTPHAHVLAIFKSSFQRRGSTSNSRSSSTAWHYHFLELAAGGDLFSLLQPGTGVGGEDVAHFYFRQLLNGVAFLHARGIAHRDLKPENLMIDANGNLKIGDFGLAAMFRLRGGKSDSEQLENKGDSIEQAKAIKDSSGRRRKCFSVCGSGPYVAPEVIRASEAGYDPDSADIWSMGVVLYVLLTGDTPWLEPDDVRDFDYARYVASLYHDGTGIGDAGNDTGAGGNSTMFSRVPSDAVSLLRGMLKPNPALRFGLPETRTHPWVLRRNPYLVGETPATTGDSSCADLDAMAVAMLANLRIDLSDTAYRATQSQLPQPTKVSSSMPAPRPMALAPAFRSQATTDLAPQPHPASKESRFLALLARDPVQRQFQPSSSEDTTQSSNETNGAARRLFTTPVLTKFYTHFPVETVVPMLLTTFFQLGHSVGDPRISSSSVSTGTDAGSFINNSNSISNGRNSDNDNTKDNSLVTDAGIVLAIRVRDRRGVDLRGSVRIGPVGAGLVEVVFERGRGDGVEWRRLFMNVVVLCRDAVYLE